MTKILKFKDDEEHKVFFYADMHYRHNPDWVIPLWEMRGFSSVLEHDAAQIENWNSKVTENDTVFLLGDTVVGGGKQSEEIFLTLLDVLNYKNLYIMPGNHYAGYKQVLKSPFVDFSPEEGTYLIDDAVEDAGKGVYFIPNYFEAYVNGTPIVMCHYPILSWNGNAHGAWMLHGHCHGTLHKRDWVEKEYYKGKVLDVGPEGTDYAPISYKEIKELFSKKENLMIDHHTRDASSPFGQSR